MIHFIDINNIQKILDEELNKLHSELLSNNVITDSDDKYVCLSKLFENIDSTASASFYINNHMYLLMPLKDNINIDAIFYSIINKNDSNKKDMSKVKTVVNANSLHNKKSFNEYININDDLNEIEYKQKMIYDEKTKTVIMPDSIIFTIDSKVHYIIL